MAASMRGRKRGGRGGGQETVAAEDRVGSPQRDQVLGDPQQAGVGGGPVDPGDLVVLAVRVVVPVLGPAQLIAAEQQRDAGRQQQGGVPPWLARPPCGWCPRSAGPVPAPGRTRPVCAGASAPTAW